MLVLLTFVPAKGATAETLSGELTPVPESATVCMPPGTPPLSSVITKLAVRRVPTRLGVKVTLIVQVACGANGIGNGAVHGLLGTALKSPE